MKRSTIFWGSFLISLGILMMLNSFGALRYNFSIVLKLWPIVFVFWGLSLLKIPQTYRLIASGLSAFLLALFIMAIINFGWHTSRHLNFSWSDDGSDSNINKKEMSLTRPYSDYFSSSSLFIKGGAGSINLNDTCSNLIEVNGEGDDKSFELLTDSLNKSLSINLNKIFDRNFFRSNNHSRQAEIKLNPKTEWDLSVDLGASEFMGDLSLLKVRNINIKTGAASVELKLGQAYNNTNLSIDAGVSSVEIQVPAGSGCQIKTNTGLSSDEFEGFKEQSDRIYRTDNFDSASKKIFIVISGGMSSFEVKRY